MLVQMKVSNDNLVKHELRVALGVIEQEIKGLSRLTEVINDNFINVIDLLSTVNGRIVVSGVGKSGHIARKLVATLSSTGSPALFIHPSEASHGDLGMIADSDIVLLLSNSGETTELNYIIDYCKRFSIPTICICRDATSTLAKASDYQLILPNVAEASSIDAPTTSSTMTLALGDVIAVVLHERRGFTKMDFKLLHPAGQIAAKLIKVYEIMHKGEAMPIVSEDEMAFDALMEMSNKRLGCVGIINTNNKLIGILTDGDIRRNIQCDFKHTKISHIMTKNPLTINEDLFASEALKIMNSNKVTNLFVLEAGEPVGVIHMHDILKAKIA